MKVVRHTLQLQLKCIDGIQVWDSRRQEGSSLCKLNKISAIASFTRNRKTKSTGSSLPLQPAGPVETCQRSDQSFRYKVFWDCDLKEEHTIVFETNLHRATSRKKMQSWSSLDQERLFLGANGGSFSKDVYESKTFQIVIGLKRLDEFVVFAASALSIQGPFDSMDLSLPLRPFDRTGSSPLNQNQQVYFKQDPGRKFALAEDACLNLTVSVHNQITFHQNQLLSVSENVANKLPNNNGKSYTSIYSASFGFIPNERKVQSERVLPVDHHIALQPEIRAYSQRDFTNRNGTHRMEAWHNSGLDQPVAYSHAMFQENIVQHEQEQYPDMHPVDNQNEFASFPPIDPNGGVAQRTIYEENMKHRLNTFPAPPRAQEVPFSHSHANSFQQTRMPISHQEMQPRRTMNHDSNMKSERWKSRNGNMASSKNRYERKSNNRRHKKKPKGTLEAFNDFYNALGDVAKQMVTENRDDVSSRSYSYSNSNSSYSSSFSDGDDEYDEEGSYSDESSRPTIPGHVKTKRESTPVHEDLTVNSYAISLAARRRSTVEGRSGSYDTASYTDDGYNEY